MVHKVIGTVDGKEFSFEKSDREDIWVVNVPADTDGEYIVDVTAYDEAGNMAFCTKYLLIVNVKNLVCKLLPIEYASDLLGEKYKSELLCKKYESDVLGKKYASEILGEKYASELIICS